MAPTEPPTPEGNTSPSVSALSSSSSPQSLDRALITSDLSLGLADQPFRQSATDDGIEAHGDPLEMINIMPKLNKSVDLYQDDPEQVVDTKSLSRAGSPELDMPLLMPELDPAPGRDPTDTETMGCVGMSIPVQLPLRKLLRHKKPPGLSVVIPTSEALASPGNEDAANSTSSPAVPSLVPPRLASLQEERMNMYSPISQASDVENLPSIDDCRDEKVNAMMQCFSPISSPGSARSTASERLGNPSDADGFLLPVSETSLLETLPISYPTPNYTGWDLYPGGLERPTTAYPWTTSQFLCTGGQPLDVRDAVDEDERLMVKETGQRKQRKKSSPRRPSSSYGNASKRTFFNEDLSSPEVFGAEGLFKTTTRGDCFENELSLETGAPSVSCRGTTLRRSDGDLSQMTSCIDRSISVPLESRTGEKDGEVLPLSFNYEIQPHLLYSVVCLFVGLFICWFANLLVCLFVGWFICLFVYLYVDLFVYLFVCLFCVCLFIFCSFIFSVCYVCVFFLLLLIYILCIIS